jgi:hypothetical protein
LENEGDEKIRRGSGERKKRALTYANIIRIMMNPTL